MKKLSILISFLFCGIVTVANTNLHPKSHTYPSAIIFTEQHIDFAIYPDGQFDFYIQNSKPNAQLVINTTHVNISFNSGYNYNPYIQYDDFGAVIQIENVPIFYDYYGRVSRIGNIFIDYNLGRLQRVGNMYLVYNPAGIFMGYQGYINPYNRTYVYKPQHKHFRKPPAQHRIVYTRPYRSYYQPKRKSYKSFKKYYKNNTNAYPRSYYKPSDAVTTYHRGRSNLNKTSSSREVYDYNNRTLLEKEIPLAVIELILLNFKINLNTTEQPQEALGIMTLQKTTDSVLQKMHVHNIDVQLMGTQRIIPKSCV